MNTRWLKKKNSHWLTIHGLKLSFSNFAWLLCLLVACRGQATPTIFVPVEQFNSPITTSTPTSTENTIQPGIVNPPPPSPTPVCVSNLLFIEDITIPDGTQVDPGEILDKRWLIENNGTCNWDQQFSLRLIAGPGMGTNPDKALFPARSGSRAEIQILFTAPQEPGIYRSAWQAADPQGNLFGDPIFIEINVLSPWFFHRHTWLITIQRPNPPMI